MRIGSQTDLTLLAAVIHEFGSPDIVIDDGSHVMDHICTTFRYLYPNLSKHGVYLVEDLHTAYWPKYGGGLHKKETFIELAKGLIDELNAEHTVGALQPTKFSRTTLSMHFYDSMVVSEKGAYGKKQALVIGK